MSCSSLTEDTCLVTWEAEELHSTLRRTKLNLTQGSTTCQSKSQEHHSTKQDPAEHGHGLNYDESCLTWLRAGLGLALIILSAHTETLFSGPKDHL